MKNISPLHKVLFKGGGWDEQRQPKMQPSAEIVRVEGTTCRQKCDLSGARATLCGDRACRVREMQARVRVRPARAKPSAEIARVECAKCRRVCDLSPARATLCGDRAGRVRDLSHARATLCEDRPCRVREMQARVRFVRRTRNPLRRSCVSSCAKCRRECKLSHARATLCGDRACRVREMQVRVPFAPCARNPLRRSGGSGARNAGESAIYPIRAQPSAESVRVESAKSRREGDLSQACVSGAGR